MAIVGVSVDPRAFGAMVLGNLQRYGYAGALHLVSRSSEHIQGLPCVKTIAELPPDLDLAVLAIPEAGVLQAVQELAARGCQAAVLFAAGYAEVGEAGRARQQQLVAAAGAMRLVGPNCMGFTHFAARLPVTFEPLPAPAAPAIAPAPGSAITVLAQSGFMAATLRDALLGRGLPLALVFSTGNEAGVGIEDVLEHALGDAATQVIAVYAEQLRQPQRFLMLAQHARAIHKPIVLLMPGRSQRAREAAASHTGALAGDHALASALLRRQAVVQVDTLDELFDSTALLLRHPRPLPGGTAFVTGSGAMKNIALDMADRLGLALPPLAAATLAQLQAKLPAFALAENPLDYTTIGVRQPGLIGELLDIVATDPAIAQLVLCIPAGPAMAQRDKADHILPALARAAKPTALIVTGDNGPLEGFFVDAVQASGVPFFRSADRALRALQQLGRHADALQCAARADAASAITPVSALPWPAALAVNGIFAEHLGKQWLRTLGIATPSGGLATTLDQALAMAPDIGWPVVLKAQASALPHKSDVGGVIVGLHDAAALRQGWHRLHANLQRQAPQISLDGILVEAMAAPGLELVVGAKRDAQWGAVLLLGLGGIWIETLQDVRLFAADLCMDDVIAELQQLQAAPLLAGTRGAPAVSLVAIAHAVCALGAQMRANPLIAEIDINPLIAYPDRVLALDALLVVNATA